MLGASCGGGGSGGEDDRSLLIALESLLDAITLDIRLVLLDLGVSTASSAGGGGG